MENQQSKLDRKGAAEFLAKHGFRCAPGTLANLATRRDGPSFVKFNRTPLYNPDELLSWANSQCREMRDERASKVTPETPRSKPVIGSREWLVSVGAAP